MAFGFIGDAIKSAGKAVTTVSDAVVTGGKEIGKLPVVGKPFKAIYSAGIASPFRITGNILKGKRIDKVAWGELKQQVSDAKTIAPYAQAVVSLVPGVGTGVSAAIGAGAALAEGRTIDSALVAGVRGAIPGGPVGQAAFDMGISAMQGKSIDAIAVQAIPGVSPKEKEIILQGIRAAKDIAEGKRVDQAIVDRAMKLAPPEVQKGIQVGIAMGHGKNLQDAMKKGAKEAMPILLNQGAKAVASHPMFKAGIQSIPKDARKGFAIGVGLMGHTKLAPSEIHAVNKSLPPNQQKGFQAAIAARVGASKGGRVYGTSKQQFGQVVARGLKNAQPAVKKRVAATIKSKAARKGIIREIKTKTFWQKILEILGVR